MRNLSPFHIGATPVVESLLAVERVSNYQLGEWSRDKFADPEAIAKIQAGIDRIFGTREQPCAFITNIPMLGRGIVAHPAIVAQLRRELHPKVHSNGE